MKPINVIYVLFVIFFVLLSQIRTSAQNIKKSNPAPKPSARLDSPQSFNARKQVKLYYSAELNLGIGLSNVNVPYSSRYIGFSAIAGYTWNNSFCTGIGAGYNWYNEGSHFPIFADTRYIFGSTRTKPVLELQTGFLLKNDKDTGHHRYFINPSVGLVTPARGNLFFTVSAGLFTQRLIHDGRRDSFANLKFGLLFR